MSAQVFRTLAEARDQFGPCALAIGNFDGVHVGHQALIRQVDQLAESESLTPAILTFDPHPTAIVAPERTPAMICTLDQRLRLLSDAGARKILVLPFTAEVARLSPEEFVSEILIGALDTRAVFVGENFRFGHKQAGTPQVLQELGRLHRFRTEFVKPVAVRGETVSSSTIRRYLEAGNMLRAGRLLGRCFTVQGPVVSGHGIGSKQTVPTLNLRPPSGQIVPKGVYVTETIDGELGNRWPSITNAGYRPTFDGTELTVETFLLGPLDGNAPHAIEVNFRHFIRSERQFPNAEELKRQILVDVAQARRYWRRVEKEAKPASSIY